MKWTKLFAAMAMFAGLMSWKAPLSNAQEKPNSVEIKRPTDGSTSSAAVEPGQQTGVLQPCMFQKTVKKTVGANYLLYLPKEYGKRSVKWPLVVYLHGAGVGGFSVKELDMIFKFDPGLPHLVAGGGEFPFIIVAPQQPPISQHVPDVLKGLLDEVIEKYAVDANRVCVTGISMGGFGTWNLATTYPEYLAAAVPVAGGGNVKLAQRMAHLPIWVFHGAKDQAVNIKGDQDMVKALREYGSDVKFTVYPDADHRGTCVLAYNTQELYDWILKQRRVAGPAASAVKVAPKVNPMSSTAAAPVQQFGPMQGCTFKRVITKPAKASYLLYLPTEYGKQSAKWPLVLYMHGESGRGNDLKKVKRDPGLRKLVSGGREFPFVLVAPQCPSDDGWEPDTLKGIVDEVIEKYAVDPDRVCVTGLSLDRGVAWFHAADPWGFVEAYPECLASAVPIGGFGDTIYGDGGYYGQLLARLPIWVFHGAKDRIISVPGDEKRVLALKQYGSDVRFTVYPDAGHDICDQAYSTPELFNWILKQRRRSAPAAPAVKVTPKGEPVTLVATSMTLTKAEVMPLSGASDGKAVKFEADGTAEGRVKLPVGGYEIEVQLWVPDKQHCWVTLEVDGQTLRQTTFGVGKLSATIPWERMRIYVDAPREVTVKLSKVQPGVLVDRLVIRPLY